MSAKPLIHIETTRRNSNKAQFNDSNPKHAPTADDNDGGATS
jgi:hypothetical protein